MFVLKKLYRKDEKRLLMVQFLQSIVIGIFDLKKLFLCFGILFKIGHPQPLFIYFRLFKQTLQFLQPINVKKYPSSIRCWDLNPQPLEHESPPINTRPGLFATYC